MLMKTEIRVMHLQAKEPPKVVATQIPGERYGTHSPSEPLEGTNHADTLILGFWPPGPVNFHCLKPLIGGSLLQQPQETHTPCYPPLTACECSSSFTDSPAPGIVSRSHFSLSAGQQ